MKQSDEARATVLALVVDYANNKYGAGLQTPVTTKSVYVSIRRKLRERKYHWIVEEATVKMPVRTVKIKFDANGIPYGDEHLSCAMD